MGIPVVSSFWIYIYIFLNLLLLCREKHVHKTTTDSSLSILTFHPGLTSSVFHSHCHPCPPHAFSLFLRPSSHFPLLA